jgi:HEAT repeat protein
MGIFGPPDVEKLKSKHDVKGLLGALKYRDSAAIRKNAALALVDILPASPGKALANAVPVLIAALEDGDPGVVNACVQALGAVGQPAFMPLLSNLRAPGERSREASARALGRIVTGLTDPSLLKLSGDPLAALLRDPTPSVRRAASWSLGRIHNRLEPAQRSLVLESLILALRDPASEVRETAAASLGRSESTRAIRPLVSALEDDSPAVRKTAAEGLAALGWNPMDNLEKATHAIARQEWEAAAQFGPAAAPALIRVLTGGDTASRVSAAQVLGKTGSPEVIEPLVKALKDQEEAVRIAAAAALEQAGAPAAVDALLVAIRDRDRDVRMAVALALAHTHDPRAVSPLMNLLRAPDKQMSAAAAKALVGLGSHAVPALLQMLSESDPAAQDTAAQALTQLGAPAVMDLTSLLREGRPPVNRLAAHILGEIRDPRAVWPLISALQISEMLVPSIQALGKIGDARAVKPLLDVLNTSFSEIVQQSTALALGMIGDPQALEPLIQMLRASEYQVRADAARALILLYRSGRLDVGQKRKILEYQDRIREKHTDIRTHQDETTPPDWHVDQSFHEDTGIGLDFHM